MSFGIIWPAFLFLIVIRVFAFSIGSLIYDAGLAYLVMMAVTDNMYSLLGSSAEFDEAIQFSFINVVADADKNNFMELFYSMWLLLSSALQYITELVEVDSC